MLSFVIILFLLERPFVATACNVDHCFECVAGYPDNCLTCEDDYKLDTDTGKCVECPSGTWGPRCSTRQCWLTTRVNCLECSRTDRCWRCEDGYYVTWYGGCGACTDGTGGYQCQDLMCDGVGITNCQTCSSTKAGTCEVCKDAFTLNGETNKCDPCPDGRIGRECIAIKCLATTRNYCYTCLSGTDRCSSCYDDFYLNWLGNCIECPGNTGGHNCEKVKCNGQVAEHCRTCYAAEDAILEPGACKVCADGYYKESNDAIICARCPNNRLSNGTVCNAVLCSGTRQNDCETCEPGETSCKLCFVGYGPKNGSCKPCDEGTGGPNCVGKTCTADQLAATDDCQFCKDDGTCVQCIKDFRLDGTECIPVNGCQTSNCRSCTVTDKKETCKRCIRGYYAIGGRCARCVGHCLECKSASVCVACEEDYALNSDVCVSKSSDVVMDSCKVPNCLACPSDDHNICVTCSSGYVWNENEKACVTACPDTNCINCDTTTGECSVCSVEYGLHGSLCYPCTINGCSKCAFHTNDMAKGVVEVCTSCSSGELTADGQCTGGLRMGRKTAFVSSVSIVILVLLVFIGIGLFYVFRRKPAPPIDSAASTVPLDPQQNVASSADGDDIECVVFRTS